LLSKSKGNKGKCKNSGLIFKGDQNDDESTNNINRNLIQDPRLRALLIRNFATKMASIQVADPNQNS
jgi:hypothetical protein